jgi:hypothetical protein
MKELNNSIILLSLLPLLHALEDSCSCVTFASRAWDKPSRQVEPSDYINRKTFKANGVNFGGWLIQEANIDPIW